VRCVKGVATGSSLRIDQAGQVYGSERPTRRESELIKRRHTDLRAALGDILKEASPMSVKPTTARSVEVGKWVDVPDPQAYGGKSRISASVTEPQLVMGPSFEWARWWRIQRTLNGQIVDEPEYLIPTLDGLVGAAIALLWKKRSRLHRCLYRECGRYYLLTGRKQSFCSQGVSP
jgi:hypothetical protein